MTGKSRVISSRRAVNCSRLEGSKLFDWEPPLRIAQIDHAMISDRPRASHAQLNTVSTLLAIVSEAETRNDFEALKML
jgi:hypothetical protein